MQPVCQVVNASLNCGIHNHVCKLGMKFEKWSVFKCKECLKNDNLEVCFLFFFIFFFIIDVGN